MGGSWVLPLLANPWSVLCCDRTNAFNKVDRSPALDNLAGVASRDYDFRPDEYSSLPHVEQIACCRSAGGLVVVDGGGSGASSRRGACLERWQQRSRRRAPAIAGAP